jgi:hypothetical protein
MHDFVYYVEEMEPSEEHLGNVDMAEGSGR